jgi:hypothetical protein
LDREEVVEALKRPGCIRRVSMSTPDGAEFRDSLYMLREDPGGSKFLFICHTKQDSGSGPLTVTVPAQGQVEEWDAESGSIFLADAEPQEGSVRIHTDLPGAGSRCFVISPDGQKDLKPRPKWTPVRQQALEPETWSISRDEANAIPLDYAEYSIQEGPWKGPLEILKVDAAVRDAAGLPHRGGRMVQPWAQVDPPEAKPVGVSLRFRFKVEEMPAGPCHLVLERPGSLEVLVNGGKLELDQDEGWWIDPSFKRIRLPPSQLRLGENEVLVKLSYGSDCGLEGLYLTGEFGAKWDQGSGVVTGIPTSLRLGDWTEQGLPCYTGSVTYGTDFEADVKAGEEVFLELPGWEGVLVKVRVNGTTLGRVAWPPWEIEVTNALKPGLNRLEIEVVSSRRNILGPLHLTEKYPVWTGSGQFETTGKQWTDGYVKLPYGLMEAPVLSFRNR